MNKKFYSNIEFTDLKNRLNKEILRRSTFRWFDPLTTPSVGEDRSSPLSIPTSGGQILVDDRTYTVNNPSEGSLERTRNIHYPDQGENPAGSDPDRHSSVPNTSAAQLNVDELKNLLIGLAKMKDINLFYGRDEIQYTAFRDSQGIEDALVAAENSILNKPLAESDCSSTKNDPNGGIPNYQHDNFPNEKFDVTYPMENDKYVMPSGEYDGEEIKTYEGLGPTNFYDDYGAKPGDSNFHPHNRYVSEITNRDWYDEDNNRKVHITKVRQGGKSSKRFGLNPRNPEKGDQYISRPVYGGVITNCDNACFRAGTLIETINGPVPIEEIKVGDEVLSKDGKYHSVYETFKRETTDLIAVRATGTPIIYTTFEHPFWVKRYLGLGYIDGKLQQLYGDPEWIEAKNLQSRDKLCLINHKFGFISVEKNIAYLAGRWLGDGTKQVFTGKNNQTWDEYMICCSFDEVDELEEKLNSANIKYTKDKVYSYTTAQRYRIWTTNLDGYTSNTDLIDIISQFGRWSYGKFIPNFVYDWNRESIESFLNGYIDADGYHTKDGKKIRTASVSKRLSYGISNLMRMLERNPSWYERSYSNNRGYIQGREVNMRTLYDLSMFIGEYSKHYTQYDQENDVAWASITLKKVPDFYYEVYNISVEGDPTYYADGVLVHNCTGLCFLTCDNQCSESCSTTCWNRCGEACTASCGNVCTGCSTMCFSSCKTKCENNTGYACVKAGAKAIKITSTGGKNGTPAQNKIEIVTYSCNGCAYSCQFYPNKKTECWDAGCMGKCFTSCNTSCSTSCYGGCIDNDPSTQSTYRTGKGRGCDTGCTLNCIGLCQGICEGYCVQTCWHACKQKCSDNCSWKCTTSCGSGCANGCKQACKGCTGECKGDCKSESKSIACAGCSMEGGCMSLCQNDCNSNCIGWGCKSICGTEGSGSCEANCRMNCSGTSCTAMCQDACSGRCSTCVNSCGWQCGTCSSICSNGCSKECNISCSLACEHSCDLNCVHSCTEECGGCSNLCYSCIGMCIGVCSVKCESGCSSCTNNCGWWCDSTCNQACFASCVHMCIQTCSGSCISFLESKSTFTSGPERDPTSEGYIYPHPSNRWQERESFRIMRNIPSPYPEKDKSETSLIYITFDEDKNLSIKCPTKLEYITKQTSIHGGIFNVNESTGEISINEDMLPDIVNINKPNLDNGGGIFIIIFYRNTEISYTNDDIYSKLPFGFEQHPLIWDSNNNGVIIIERDEFLYPEEGDDI